MINNGVQNSWSSLDYMSFYENALFPYQGISYCDYVFVPTVFKEHWWLYALNCRTRQLHVLDSIGHGIQDRFKIDKAMVDRLQHLFEILDEFSGKSGAQISLVKENVPLQPNSYDCGILVVKYMELWDGSQHLEGNTFPNYTTKELLRFRQEMLTSWVMHESNVQRKAVLTDLEVDCP
ncbi:putative ubiquitin-like-specific protease 1B [Phaseolus vulgaris]|uniref:putative ubiquitin-like-specific protease 1B n=1 Tax=Phaseolus vulgaris TaxID=3885 RepID=UPI0035CB7563